MLQFVSTIFCIIIAEVENRKFMQTVQFTREVMVKEYITLESK